MIESAIQLRGRRRDPHCTAHNLSKSRKKLRGAEAPRKKSFKEPGTEVPVERLYPEHRMDFNHPMLPSTRVKAPHHTERTQRIFAVLHEILESFHEGAIRHLVEIGSFFCREKATASCFFHRRQFGDGPLGGESISHWIAPTDDFFLAKERKVNDSLALPENLAPTGYGRFRTRRWARRRDSKN